MKPIRNYRMDGICASCGVREKAQPRKYCLPCHAKWMREHRVRHSDLPPIARRKANARALANVYKRRGKLKKEDCEVCGSAESEMHHDDYDKPLAVRWLCRPCHLEVHALEIQPKEKRRAVNPD
jgi:hypothetical protein